MKLNYREIEPFVKTPDKKARVVLIYGPDLGLVKERTQLIGKTITPDLQDPFNVCVLTADQLSQDPARLADEAHAISMMGGDRLIKIEDGGDKITLLIKSYLENPSAYNLVIVQAGELGTKSSLRALCEKAKNAVALPCYVDDERNLAGVITDFFRGAGRGIDRDAVSWLSVHVSGDRQKVRSALEKLIIYKGAEEGNISLSDVQAACGYAGAQSFDDLVYATAGGNVSAALRAYHTLTAEGENFTTIIRILQNHFRRLHITKAYMAKGEAADQAINRLKPEVFFKYKDKFQSQLHNWTLAGLDQVLNRLSDLEVKCKTTAMPVETVCAQAILAISRSKS